MDNYIKLFLFALQFCDLLLLNYERSFHQLQRNEISRTWYS